MNILITGSNKGIGFETARQLGRQGHKIILSGRHEARLNAAAEDLARENIKVEILIMDVHRDESVLRAAKEFSKLKFKLDVLINNAAVLNKSDRNLLTNDDAVLEETLSVNSLGALRVSKAFISSMHTPGRIINISSGGGSMTDPVGGWSPAYCVSKSLLNAITRHLAYELEGRNISVNAVCPGWVKTDMGGNSAPGTVKEGADTIVWLATKERIPTGKFFRDRKVIQW